jgi:hypothetical protein
MGQDASSRRINLIGCHLPSGYLVNRVHHFLSIIVHFNTLFFGIRSYLRS